MAEPEDGVRWVELGNGLHWQRKQSASERYAGMAGEGGFACRWDSWRRCWDSAGQPPWLRTEWERAASVDAIEWGRQRDQGGQTVSGCLEGTYSVRPGSTERVKGGCGRGAGRSGGVARA